MSRHIHTPRLSRQTRDQKAIMHVSSVACQLINDEPKLGINRALGIYFPFFLASGLLPASLSDGSTIRFVIIRSLICDHDVAEGPVS